MSYRVNNVKNEQKKLVDKDSKLNAKKILKIPTPSTVKVFIIRYFRNVNIIDMDSGKIDDKKLKRYLDNIK